MNHKTERDEALAKWQRECEGGSVPVTPMMRHAYRDGWDDALAGQSAGVTDEPKRGTDAQILFERKLTCEAINGAIAFGYQNTNPPPSDDHWLAPFWKIGRKQAELEAVLTGPSSSETIHQVWVEKTSSWADVTPAYYSERLPSNRRKVYYKPTFASQSAGVAAETKRGTDAQADERGAIYVECRECAECGHIGINDSHPTDAACDYSCDWTGPSPIKDKCPGCGNENVMTDACPKCSGRYKFMADATIQTSVAAPKAEAAQGVATSLSRTRSALYAIAKTLGDSELRQRALEAYEATFTAPSPDREQAAYSAPFNTDVPHCCGEPSTCNDPCRDHDFESDKPIPIVTYDDGALVILDSWTGGAHEAGVFGEIALRFIDAHGVETVREYRAKTAEQPSERGERPIEPEDIDAVAEAIQRETSVEWLIASRAAVAAIDTLIARGNHASEHGEQDCPHGVDDGACKQCYGEATSVEQGAALSDDARECLMDVVSHHDNIVAGFAAQRLNACEAGDSDNATYWTREMNVAHRMKTQAERALAASASTLGETVQGKPMATTAEFDVAIETLRHVIECLRNTGRYTDEEGEATDFLEPLLYAHLSVPQPQVAEPLIHWRDKPQNIALLAVERGDPVDCDGTFACPICGKDEPHQHSSEEIAKFRTTQPQAAEPKGMAVQEMRLLAMRYAANYTEFDDGSLHTIDFGEYGFVNFARAILSKGE